MKRKILSPLLLVAACYHGPSLATFTPAHSPAGIAADIRLKNTRIRGELLEAQDTALIVLTDSGRVMLVLMKDISDGRFAQLGDVIVDGQRSQQSLAQLRSFSRFPAGMTPRIRVALLAAYGQTEVQLAR